MLLYVTSYVPRFKTLSYPLTPNLSPGGCYTWPLQPDKAMWLNLWHLWVYLNWSLGEASSESLAIDDNDDDGNSGSIITVTSSSTKVSSDRSKYLTNWNTNDWHTVDAIFPLNLDKDLVNV